ncbi:hypothetical protein IJ541_02145 [bacterium]|nr:hypothetical protein [bacterium]
MYRDKDISYSIFSQAYKHAIYEYGDPDGWNLTASTNSSNIFFDYLKPYLKIEGVCEKNKKYCFYSGEYKSLFGAAFAQQPNNMYYSRQAQLINGVSFVFFSDGNCQNITNSCGVVYVDVNGIAPPNKAGVDYFIFGFISDGTLAPRSPINSNWICEYNNKSAYNGTYCTKWAIKKGNMDYLRRDISAEIRNL